ncbi:MAG TPA: Ig-like domain-containing protein [Candidatus Saccharibacteria bacterium]|nr:Ig-like domain-containing protein [Candidatus Saccharibacteria bacterium]
MTKKSTQRVSNKKPTSAIGSGKARALGKRSIILFGALFVTLAFGAASYLSGDQFRSSSAAVPQRFPGDPNPLISGKAYFGASGNYIATHEAAAGKSVAIYRKFNQWNTASSAVSTINSNYSNNRLVWISFKTPKWSEVAAGTHDSTLDSMLRTLDNAGKPVWVTFWHEPENDEGQANAGSATDFVNMQRHIRSRIDALNTTHIAFAPVYQSSKIVSMGSAHNNWYGSGIWDFIGFDIYQPNDTLSILNSKWTTTIAWVESKGLPFAIGEWGVRTTAPSSQITDFWNWQFTNNKDMVGMSYFDSDANSNGSWILAGANNTTFNTILKSDTKVMRVNELGSSTGGGGGGTPAPDTTKPTVSLTSPSNGETVKGTILVTGTASDNVGVKSVSLRIDDSYVKSDSASPYQFSIDTTTYSDGDHTVKLRAFDDANNQADSATITLKVDNVPASTGGGSSGGSGSTSGGSSSNGNTTVVSTKTSSSKSNPVPVDGTLVIKPSSPNSDVSVKVDGKEVDGNAVNTEGLTNGTHTVSVTEDGKTKHITIDVNNPWYLALLNHFLANYGLYTMITTAGVSAIWLFHRQISGFFSIFPTLRLRH